MCIRDRTWVEHLVGVGVADVAVQNVLRHLAVDEVELVVVMISAQMCIRDRFSVSEVMYTVGFSNSSYFSKCFSKAFGMTPTEYMKQK